MAIKYSKWSDKPEFELDAGIFGEWCGTVEDLKCDIEEIASSCAEEYYQYHDGWECDWPIELTIFKDNELIGKVEVTMEMTPSFSAAEL